MSTRTLTAHSLTVGYRNGTRARPVLCDLGLDLRAGEIVCLIGPNGVGKSTLLRTLSGLLPPLAGRVMLDEVDVHAMSGSLRARQVAVVLPRRVTVDALTVWELAALGRLPHTDRWGRLTVRDRMAVEEALAATGLSALAEREASTLSDGEWQKVMMARALAQETTVLILDEPTAFLDVHHRAEVMALLRRLAHDRGRMVLLSSHDLDMALHTADRLWVITPERRIYTGAPEDLVLEGVVERAFPSREVTFDVTTGTFRVPMPVRGEVALEGRGVRAYWTRRALERTGWRITRARDRAWITVSVLSQGGRTGWLVAHGGRRRLCHSLLELTAYLETLPPQTGPDVRPSRPAVLCTATLDG